MTYLTADSKEDLIETILSIDNSLLFQTREQLIMTMRSIDFIETERHDKNNFCWIRFNGSIGNQIIMLHFSHNLGDSTDTSFYLSNKTFYKQMWGTTLPHRDNNLPSNLSYGTGDSIRSTRSFQYHYCGELKRIDLKDPIIVNIDENITSQYYYIPENTSNHDVYLHFLQLVNEKVASAIFSAGQLKIPLETLYSIVPNSENFTLQELIEINDHLSDEEKNLIQMVNI